MTLPIRTTVEDIDVVCGYLVTKPTGATLAEAKAVVAKKYLDGRKMSALKCWGLVEEVDDKIRITQLGREIVRDSGASRSEVLRDVVRSVAPYMAVVERVVHRHETTMAAVEVGAHWFEHFSNEAGDSDKILNDQAVCFFQVAQGADLGTLIKGRGGMPTRFVFESEIARAFVGQVDFQEERNIPQPVVPSSDDYLADTDEPLVEEAEHSSTPSRGNRVFLTHGKNLKILDQVKEIVTFGKFQPVVAMEHETAAKPVPQKVLDEMKTCDAAVIHVSSERVLLDESGEIVHSINENILIEIGAAMALYGDRFVLLVENGVSLPSNLQGLYECRYHGSELNMEAAMKLLKAFNDFGQE